MTFDLAHASPDVVLAHLDHPLVAQSTTLLRSAIWGTGAHLHRATAVKVSFPANSGIDGAVVVVFARLMVVGADGHRLHEEVMTTARVLSAGGRGRRLELDQPRLSPIRDAIEDAFNPGATRAADPLITRAVADDWERVAKWLVEDIELRSAERPRSLERDLLKRSDDETRRVQAVFARTCTNRTRCW